MISGDAATRILLEVLRGVSISETDTPEERDYRVEVKSEVDEIHAKGGVVAIPKEWP